MIRTCDRGHASLDAANWKCPWCEIEQLRVEVDRLAACKFPDSRSIYVVTLPNGERWACADVVGTEIERLRARVAELEKERNEARSLLSTVNSSDYSLGLLVRELRARVKELENDTERLAAIAWPVCVVDEIGEVDIHEEAYINASVFGRDEPNKDDYLDAIRTAIDAAMKEKSNE